MSQGNLHTSRYMKSSGDLNFEKLNAFSVFIAKLFNQIKLISNPSIVDVKMEKCLTIFWVLSLSC